MAETKERNHPVIQLKIGLKKPTFPLVILFALPQYNLRTVRQIVKEKGGIFIQGIALNSEFISRFK